MRKCIFLIIFLWSNLSYSDPVWDSTSKALYYQFGLDKTVFAVSDYLVKEIKANHLETEIAVIGFGYRIYRDKRIMFPYKGNIISIYRDKVEVVIPVSIW